MACIVIADEDQQALLTLGSILEADGHRVLTAYDGKEAYDMSVAGHPDMAFLAVSMAYFNGYETCGLLRNDPAISVTMPIVLVSAQEISSQHLEQVGATDCISKEFDLSKLRDLVLKHLGPDAYVDATA